METGTGLVRALIAAVDVGLPWLIMFFKEGAIITANYSKRKNTDFWY